MKKMGMLSEEGQRWVNFLKDSELKEARKQ